MSVMWQIHVKRLLDLIGSDYDAAVMTPQTRTVACLGLAQTLQGQTGVWALAADTDGIDGIEDNAGARLSPETLQRAAALGLSLSDYQQRNDAYGFFAALDDLVVTGPTHTNVNDFRAILVL